MILKGLFWLAQQIGEAVDLEIAQLREMQMGALSDLHRALESGQIADQDFDSKELQILDALDELEELAQSRGLL